MKLRHPIAALSLCLLAGTAFAATPATSPAAATPTSSAKAPAKGKTVHCKHGETLVKGKCEKPKS